MLTVVNRLKTTGRHGSQVEDAIPPTSTGAVASSQGARGGGLAKSQAKLKCVAKNFKQAETESEKTVPSTKFLRAKHFSPCLET